MRGRGSIKKLCKHKFHVVSANMFCIMNNMEMCIVDPHVWSFVCT